MEKKSVKLLKTHSLSLSSSAGCAFEVFTCEFRVCLWKLSKCANDMPKLWLGTHLKRSHPSTLTVELGGPHVCCNR